MEKLKKHIQSIIDIYKSGNLSKAESLTRELINDNTKVVFLYNLLGLILAEQKKFDEAIKCYEEGIKINPNFGMIYNNMGLLFFKNKSNDNIKKSENFYKKAIALDKKIPEPHNNLGNLYEYLNKIDEAIACYKKAININPKFSYAHHNLGTAYVAKGKFDKAKKHFFECLKVNPNFTFTHRSLSRITKYTSKSSHFTELKKIYKNLDKSDSAGKIELGYALGKAYEDIKDYDKSFFHYDESNQLQRKKINFSISAEKEQFDKIKLLYNKEFINKYKNVGFKKNSPIFIIGMPRSSTTLVEQILSNHPKVYGAEEVNFIPNIYKKNLNNHNFNESGNEYIERMRLISNSSERTTDKLPINFLYIGFIKLILPNSKIIHCYRNSRDNCLSIYKNQFSSGQINFAYNISEIVEYYNYYDDLMNFWKKVFPDFIYNIKYENLISNTKKEVKALLNYCDLTWNNDCLNFHKNKRLVKSASDIQVRKKIYSNSINSWKNYEKFLLKDFLKLKS